MGKLHRLFCAFLGWTFTLLGVAAMVTNNHAAERATLGSADWWAFLSALPIGALFLIAYGVSPRPSPPGGGG